MNKIGLLCGVLALLTACNNEEDTWQPLSGAEITGITATIDGELATTRAAAVAEDAVTVGRSVFQSNEKIVFTTIKRTIDPLKDFTYSNIQYIFENGQSWERTPNGAQYDPEKIYWTDGSSAHTFIGYSLPLQSYHWETVSNATGSDTYAGELGYGEEVIDFTSGNDAIKAEDLLVSYSETTRAESDGLSTKVQFTHALSNVRVVVNIKDFAATASAVDTRVGISDMIIFDQPARYTWGGNSQSLTVVDFADQGASHVKDLKLWCPEPDGEGTGLSKTFTFYGLTTPQDALFHEVNGNNKPLTFQFTVTYPDPMNPSGASLVKTYKGTFAGTVNFVSGKCTTLNISLNHRDEQMFMGVEYSDWNYVSTPDLGELRKKSTFLDINSDVTIHTEARANVYDATWLYKAGDQIKDIYGNDGSKSAPYRISTASQLLSFAKEVKNGYVFTGKYIRLDADITMQASTAKTHVEDTISKSSPVVWIGIGDADHAFNGTFLGGDRFINRLYGSPLFANVGSQATIESLQITTIGSITGGGALADKNAGVIGGCRVTEGTETTGGALVGTNSGTLYACYHMGETPLVGTTSSGGKTVGCYTGTDISSLTLNQLSTLVNRLNTELDAWYATDEANGHTQYQFIYSAGNYPTIQRK